MKSLNKRKSRLHREDMRARLSPAIFVTINVCLILYSSQSTAFNWSATPYLQAEEIYSDNITLEQAGNKKSAFVTSVNPSLYLFGQSAKSSLNLNYRMQNLYNAAGDNDVSIFHQLNTNYRNTLLLNKLFLNSYASISQQNINNNRIGADNINGSTNSTNVYNYGITPYWTPHFGNYAFGSASVSVNAFATSGGTTNSNTNLTGTNLNGISDSVNVAETINLNSGSYFQRINWNLSFNNNENFRVNSPNIKFQNSTGRISTSINRKFNVFAQAGYSNSDYQSITGNNDSGFYYTFGGQWIPSQRYSITAGAGNNNYVSFYVSPFSRLTWTTTYTNNAVGTNFGQYSGGNSTTSETSSNTQYSGVNGGGNSNQNWQTALNYNTKRSNWFITHINNTTTSQQILSQYQVFSDQSQDVPGQNQLSPAIPNQRIINNPTLNDEVIVSKTWNIGFSYGTGKSTWYANAYDQNYQYQSTGEKQTAMGVSGSWVWNFASKTNAFFTPQWQHTVTKGTSNNSQYYMLSVGVRQAITSRLYGVLEYRHVNQTSEQDADNFLQGNGFANDYQENRATASLSMRF